MHTLPGHRLVRVAVLLHLAPEVPGPVGRLVRVVDRRPRPEPDAQQQLLLRLPPSTYDGDRGSWGIIQAETHYVRGDLARAPRGRSVLMIGIGLVVMIWTIASLV